MSFTNDYHVVIVRRYIESNVDNKCVGIFFYMLANNICGTMSTHSTF